MTFTFNGMNGNENNFETQEACEAACDTWQIPGEWSSLVCWCHGLQDWLTILSPSSERCLLEVDGGTGNENNKFYAWKQNTRECVKFVYKGQEGNDNKFATKEECRDACKVRMIASYDIILSCHRTNGVHYARSWVIYYCATGLHTNKQTPTHNIRQWSPHEYEPFEFECVSVD